LISAHLKVLPRHFEYVEGKDVREQYTIMKEGILAQAPFESLLQCSANTNQSGMLRLFYETEILFLLQKKVSVSTCVQKLFEFLWNQKLGLSTKRFL
jgi:hypothetical protein